MFKQLSMLVCAGLLLAGTTLALAADPKPSQIYDAVRAGNYVQAEEMINQVLRDHPNDAKAHYVAAEVYARVGDYPVARRELTSAQSLDPSLSFASPRAVQELRTQLYAPVVVRQAGGGFVAAPARSSGIPWSVIIIVLAVVAIAWMLFRRRSAGYYGGGYPTAGAPGAPGMGAGGAPYPYGPGGMPYGGGGSGLLGSLGTGLAVGAGVAAGEELAHRVLDGHSGGGVIPSAEAAEPPPPDPNQDMGGQDFGLNNDSWGSDGGGGGGDFGVGGGDDWT